MDCLYFNDWASENIIEYNRKSNCSKKFNSSYNVSEQPTSQKLIEFYILTNKFTSCIFFGSLFIFCEPIQNSLLLHLTVSIFAYNFFYFYNFT